MIKDIENLPYFTLGQLALYLKDRKKATVYIDNWLKSGKIHRVARGVYVSDSKLKELTFSNKLNIFQEFIATNVVYVPSYISLDYVLFENAVLTENVYNITCITTKKTAKFSYNLRKFSYRSIKKEFFDGYNTVYKDGFVIYKATLEKALFDWFYLKRGIVWDIDYFRQLRLNLYNIDIKKFEELANKYKNKKLLKVVLYIKRLKG